MVLAVRIRDSQDLEAVMALGVVACRARVANDQHGPAFAAVRGVGRHIGNDLANAVNVVRLLD